MHCRSIVNATTPGLCRYDVVSDNTSMSLLGQCRRRNSRRPLAAGHGLTFFAVFPVNSGGRNRHIPATVVGRLSSSHEIAHDQWSCSEIVANVMKFVFTWYARTGEQHARAVCRGGTTERVYRDDRVEKQQLSHSSVITSIISDLSIF